MGRKESDQQNIRKLSKVGGGGSYAMTLPIDIIRQLDWQEHQKLVVEREGDYLVIRDWE